MEAHTVTIEQSITDLASSHVKLTEAVVTLAKAIDAFADRFEKAEQATEARRVIVRKDGRVKTVPADEPETLREKMAARKATGKEEYQPRIQKTTRVIPAGQLSGEAEETPAPAEAEQAPAPEVKAETPAPKVEKPAPAKAEQPKKENPFGAFPIDAATLGEIDEEKKLALCEEIFPWLQHAVTVDKAAVIALFGKYSPKDEQGVPVARNPRQLPAATFAAFLADCAKLGA